MYAWAQTCIAIAAAQRHMSINKYIAEVLNKAVMTEAA